MGSIYWFNGSRFEYWCKSQPFENRFCYFDFIYKNKKFKKGGLNTFNDEVPHGNLICRRLNNIELFDHKNKTAKNTIFIFCIFITQQIIYFWF